MSGHGKKRRLWSVENMKEAYNAVVEDVSISAAARRFGVPRMTLSDRIRGKIQLGAKLGNRPPWQLLMKPHWRITLNTCTAKDFLWPVYKSWSLHGPLTTRKRNLPEYSQEVAHRENGGEVSKPDTKTWLWDVQKQLIGAEWLMQDPKSSRIILNSWGR